MDLGIRLSAVAALVQPAEVIADVGCDHGYLSVFLTEQKRCKRVIAMDVNRGPLERAKETILRSGFGDYIETRLSDGLNKLTVGEAEGCVCAGMGGPLALRILWNDREKVSKMQQVILQPQSELWLVRRTLAAWGFVTEEECMAYEDGKYYFMMRLLPPETFAQASCVNEADEFLVNIITKEGLTKNLEKLAYEMYGEVNITNKNPLLKEFLEKEHKRIQGIRSNLSSHGDSLRTGQRLWEIECEEEVLLYALSCF
ncbi:MAG: SAM-dependent methyltransferase [Lachnospiraceae bacterium]|nr:SAM-dependent methyltransferase [Lachnospiraceae bacterium]